MLAAWLAEETSSLREDVYDILPFVFRMASESLERCRPGPALVALQLSLEARTFAPNQHAQLRTKLNDLYPFRDLAMSRNYLAFCCPVCATW